MLNGILVILRKFVCLALMLWIAMISIVWLYWQKQNWTASSFDCLQNDRSLEFLEELSSRISFVIDTLANRSLTPTDCFSRLNFQLTNTWMPVIVGKFKLSPTFSTTTRHKRTYRLGWQSNNSSSHFFKTWCVWYINFLTCTQWKRANNLNIYRPRCFLHCNI